METNREIQKCYELLNKMHYFTIYCQYKKYYQYKRSETNKTFERERERGIQWITTSIILTSHHYEDTETPMGNLFFFFKLGA